MNRIRVVPLLFLLCAFPLLAAPPAKEQPLVKVTYEVGDLVETFVTWKKSYPARTMHIQASGAEAVAEVVMRMVEPASWKPGKKDAGSVEVIQGTKLVVLARAKQHREIADLLAALRRMTDLAVGFETELHEIPRDVFTKHLEPLLVRNGPVAVVEEAVGDLVRNQKGRLRLASVQLRDGKSGTFFSQQQAFSFLARPTWAVKEDGERHAVAFHGLNMAVDVNVTPDRRGVRLKLRRQVKELVALNEESVLNPKTEKMETIESPDLRGETQSLNLNVDDGVELLMVLPRTSRVEKERDKVRVLLTRVVISIEEEKRALQNNGKK